MTYVRKARRQTEDTEGWVECSHGLPLYLDVWVGPVRRRRQKAAAYQVRQVHAHHLRSVCMRPLLDRVHTRSRAWPGSVLRDRWGEGVRLKTRVHICRLNGTALARQHLGDFGAADGSVGQHSRHVRLVVLRVGWCRRPSRAQVAQQGAERILLRPCTHTAPFHGSQRALELLPPRVGTASVERRTAV
jgi:hypothetical protein